MYYTLAYIETIQCFLMCAHFFCVRLAVTFCFVAIRNQAYTLKAYFKMCEVFVTRFMNIFYYL